MLSCFFGLQARYQFDAAGYGVSSCRRSAAHGLQVCAAIFEEYSPRLVLTATSRFALTSWLNQCRNFESARHSGIRLKFAFDDSYEALRS